MFTNQQTVAVNSVLSALCEIGESIHCFMKTHDPIAYKALKRREELLGQYGQLTTDAARADFWLKHAVDIEL